MGGSFIKHFDHSWLVRDHRGKLVLGLGTAGLFLLILLNNGPAAADPSRPKKPAEITAAVPKNFPPNYFLDEEGRPAGFAIEVMEAVARRGGMKVNYLVEEDWPRTAVALRSGRADLIPNLGITSERLKEFDFTSPVETFEVVLFVRSSTYDINSLSDLAGRRAGAVKFNVGVDILKDLDETMVKVFESNIEALFGLLSGEVDALIYPKSVLLALAGKAGVDHEIKTVGAPLMEVNRAVAVRKGETALLNRLNQAVTELTAADEYRQIYTKWYGKSRPFWTPGRAALAMSGILLMVAALLVAWRFRSVVHVNRRLQKALDELRQAQKALSESEETARVMLNAAQETALLIDPVGRILAVNEAGAAVWETSKESGRRLETFLPAKAADMSRLMMGEVLRTGRPVRFETESDFGGSVQERDADRGVFFQISLYPIVAPDGKVTQLAVYIRDITEIRKSEARLKAALQEKEVLLREIHHRVKNNMQVVSSLLNLQADRLDNQTPQAVFREAQSRVTAMALIHEALYQSSSLAVIDFRQYLSSLAAGLFQTYGRDPRQIGFDVDVQGVSLILDYALPCGLVLNELISNSLKHAFPDDREGEIRIEVESGQDNLMTITISDNGVGLPPGLDWRNPGTLGLTLVKGLVEHQLGGRLEVNQEGGTKFILTFKQETYRQRI